MNIKTRILNFTQKLVQAGRPDLANKLAKSQYKPMQELYDPFKYPVESIKEYREKVDSTQADFTTDQYITTIDHKFPLNKGLYGQQDKIKSTKEFIDSSKEK